MPWCPKCKTEYREGIVICADCKVELVEEYKEVLLQNATELLVKVDAEHQMFTKKLHDFLEYSGISSVVLEDKEDEMLCVYVAPENFNKAKKIFKAFYSVETESVMQKTAETAFLKGEEYEDYFGDDEEDDIESGASDSFSAQGTTMYKTANKDSDVSAEEKHYVSAASRYDDYRSSGYTFTILGVLGIGFAILNFMDVITLFGSTFSSFVLFVMFSVFLGLGIFSFVKAEKLKGDAEQENALIAEAKAWIAENITPDMIIALDNTDEDDEIKSAELLYLDRLDELVAMVLARFPGLHDTLAEQLIEEFCGQHAE